MWEWNTYPNPHVLRHLGHRPALWLSIAASRKNFSILILKFLLRFSAEDVWWAAAVLPCGRSDFWVTARGLGPSPVWRFRPCGLLALPCGLVVWVTARSLGPSPECLQSCRDFV